MADTENKILHLAESARQLNNAFLEILENRYGFHRKVSFRASEDEFFGEQFYRADTSGDYSCRWSNGAFREANIYIPISRKEPKLLKIYGRVVSGLKLDSLSIYVDLEPAPFDLDDRGDGAAVLSIDLPEWSSKSITLISVCNVIGETKTIDGREVFFCFEALSVE